VRALDEPRTKLKEIVSTQATPTSICTFTLLQYQTNQTPHLRMHVHIKIVSYQMQRNSGMIIGDWF